jgi:hypothetical protein
MDATVRDKEKRGTTHERGEVVDVGSKRTPC